jgi:hypothetical protein
VQERREPVEHGHLKIPATSWPTLPRCFNLAVVPIGKINRSDDFGLVLFLFQIPSFFTLSITSIFKRMHRALNIGKINN